MNRLKISGIALLVFCTPLVHSQEPASPGLRTVELFIAAFNAHDSSAMATFVTDDVKWLTIAGEEVTVETKGKSDLVESMNAYFESCPSCQSSLSGVISTPVRVSALEIASWQSKDGPKSQQSLSVYEFSGELINRVYYFSVE